MAKILDKGNSLLAELGDDNLLVPVVACRPRNPGTVSVYRDSVNTPLTAADTLAVPSISTSIPAGTGSLTNATHGVQVVAGNKYGRTTANTATTQATGGANTIIRVTFSQVTGAEFYDLYLSTSTTAPLYVGRVTEAQRAAGCTITAAASATANATIGAGGVAGAVDVYVVGTVSNRTVANDITNNTAYTPDSISEIDGSGYSTLEISALYSNVSAGALPALSLQFWVLSATGVYVMDSEAVVPIGLTYPQRQAVRFPIAGRTGKVLVSSLSGAGATVSLYSRLLA